MTTPDLTIPLPDRHNGFVMLTDDGKGNPYVPDFVKSYDTGTEAGNAMKFAGAFLVLASRHFPNEHSSPTGES